MLPQTSYTLLGLFRDLLGFSSCLLADSTDFGAGFQFVDSLLTGKFLAGLPDLSLGVLLAG